MISWIPLTSTPKLVLLSDLEEGVKYPQNLLKDKHKVYCFMEKNEQDAKVKHSSQFYAKYWRSLKNHCIMAKLIFSIAPNQVENEHNFSIARFFSRARRSILTIKNLAMITLINRILQFNEQLINEDLRDEDIYLVEEYLE